MSRRPILDTKYIMNIAVPCTICNERTHKTNKCPELWLATPSGGGGGDGHDHDDDEQLSKLSDPINIDAPAVDGTIDGWTWQSTLSNRSSLRLREALLYGVGISRIVGH